MRCCAAYNPAGANRFFSWFARRYSKRYRRKGLERTQRQLVAGLRTAGLERASLLEIGCGVGYLHQHLMLQDGATSALGIDLADRMVAEARRLAADAGLAACTDYMVGDFVELSPTIAPADVVILDKVICCYPDAETLVARSLAKAQRVYAFTIPRHHRFNRIAVAAMAWVTRLLRIDFRSFVHDPDRIEQWVRARGFEKRFEATTPIWLTQVYSRRKA